MIIVKKYFLGANSGNGFYSLYDGFCAGKGDFLHLIKAGPGCGKSSFMRCIAKAAEERGYEVEYVLCSGDPDSLDGIYIPGLKCGYADATAPHIIEPWHFGVDSDYVNLGQFCSRPPAEKIKLYTNKYKTCYDRTYSLLKSAALIKTAPLPWLIDDKAVSKIRHRARSAVNRGLGVPCGNGTVKKRFIRGISCMGEIVLSETVDILCKQVYVLDNRLGLAKYYLDEVIAEASKRNDDIIICPSPLLPEELEAVIFPAQKLGFIAGDVYASDKPWRHIRLDAMVSPEKLRACKSELKKSEKIYSCIMDSVYLNLAEAKHWHDELEAVYKPYIDFAALDGFTEKEIKKLFA